jgi:hypothetical protein
MEQLITFISLSLIIIFWTQYFTPIQPFRIWVITSLSNWIVKKQLYYLHPVLTLMNCNKCLGFWGGWLYYWDIRYGLMLSVLTFLLAKLIAYVSSDTSCDSK